MTSAHPRVAYFCMEFALHEDLPIYAGGPYDRVAQEVLLGIGGVRALRALGLPVDVYHFNEGHAVLAGIELIRERIEEMEQRAGGLRVVGDPFQAALREVREQIVFTT